MQNPASITRAAGLTTKQAIALSAVFCSLSCLPCSGQVLKGSKPEVPQAPMTPAQLQERIRAAHSPSRTLSAVRSPYASQPDDAAIIAVLRSQKQAADRELQEIQALRRNAGNTHASTTPTTATQSPGGQAGAQPSASGNTPAAMPGTRVPAIRGQSASQTVSPAAANAGSLPQGPMGTRSASGGQHGSAPKPAVAAGPNSTIVGAVCPLPHIDTVSGQATERYLLLKVRLMSTQSRGAVSETNRETPIFAME